MPQVTKPWAGLSSDQRLDSPGRQPPCNGCWPASARAPALPLSLVPARIWHDQAFQAASETARATERHDRASGSHDCGHADHLDLRPHRWHPHAPAGPRRTAGRRAFSL